MRNTITNGGSIAAKQAATPAPIKPISDVSKLNSVR
jgi:hypothetical protein